MKNLKVTNDNAKLGMALIQTYDNTIIGNEDQRQFMLKMFTEHRKAFPTPAIKFL